MDSGFFWPVIKQKNIQKISIFLSLLLFCGITFAQPAEKAEVLDPKLANLSLEPVAVENLVIVPTQTVQPLQIIVNDPEPGLPFSGEVLSRRPFSAEKIIFSLYDDNGLIVWEDMIPLGNEAVRVVPFYFPDVAVEGDLRLVIKAKGKESETLAMGERPASFPFGTNTTKLISAAVTLEEDNTARVEIELKGGAFNETFIPYVKIYKERRTTEALYAEYEDLPVKITPQVTKKVAFKVDNFLSTGVYILDVGLKDFRSKDPLDAYFSETIFSPGDYIRINQIKVSLSTEEASKVDIDLKGLAFLGEPSAIGSTISVFDGDDKISEKAGSIFLDNGYFVHTLQFELREIRPDFKGEIVLRSPNGESLATQAFDFSGLDASLFQALESAEVKPDLEEIVLEENEHEIAATSLLSIVWKWVNQNIVYIGGVGGGVFFLLILVIITKRICHNFWWIGVGTSALVAPWLALSFELPFYPTVEWVQPNITALSAYNPDSKNGFQIMPVEGRLYNGLTGQGFFDQDIIKEWRINFIDDQGKNYQFSLKDDYFAAGTQLSQNVGTGFYQFYIDLSKVENSIPLGASEKLIFTEGDWKTQLLFKFYNEKESVHTWYATDYADDLSRFIVDRSAPKVKIELLDTEGKKLEGDKFTNQPITANIACADEFSECLWKQKRFTIKGNFCADGTQCNNRAARQIVICDLAQNCETKEIVIDFYDPVPPKLSFFNLNGSSLGRVSKDYELNLRYEEPRGLDDVRAKGLFMDHICADPQSDHYLSAGTNQCFPKRYPCVFKDKDRFVRGHDTGKGCTQSCPEGFEYQNGSCQVPCNNQSFLSGEMCFPFIFSGK